MKKKREFSIPIGNEMRLRLRKMKLTLLMTFLVMASFGSGFSQVTLSLQFKKANIQEVLGSIEIKTDYIFIYKDDILNGAKEISVDFKDAKFEDVLKSICEQSNVDYEVRERQIILKHKTDVPVASVTQQVNKKELSGTVNDSKGIPLPGATVYVKGTTMGTITDNEGKFRFTVPVDAKILVFSFVGMKTQEITISGKTIVNIVFEETTVDFDEVVVVGYGIQKKESVVGSIGQVKGADLVKSGVPSIANSLTGRVPGMVTVQQSGLPGADDSKIYIRGLSSFTGDNQPLILVDGIERSMNFIDPSDVESISVLKDASATAVYGVKGGNGVILVTTKRGQLGRMEISVSLEQTMKASASQGFQENSYNTLFARDNMYRNQNSYSKVLGTEILEHYRTHDQPYIYPDIDAWDKGMKDFGMDKRASVSARGGTKNAKYFISLGYQHEGDILKSVQTLYDADFKSDQINFRMNFDFDFTKSTKVSISSNGYIGTRSFGGVAGDQRGTLNNLYAQPPYLTPYVYPAEFVAEYPDPNNPEISDRVAGSLVNPGAAYGYLIHNYKGSTLTTTDRLGADISISQKLDAITKGLSFKLAFSYNTNSTWDGGGYSYNADNYVFSLVGDTYRWDRYLGSSIDNYTVVAPPFQTALVRSGNPADNYVYSGQFDYSRSFNKHNISGLALAQRRISQNGAGFPHYEENWAVRATYDYDGKYLFEANIGISGSEQFAPANRFGYFPAAAIGWNVAKEPFMKELLPDVNNLKLRYSYGESGNDNTGSQWLYISQYTNWTSYVTGSPGTSKNLDTYKEGSFPNINAKWERAKKHNLGLDLGLFSDAFTLSAELYSENRDGILMARRAIAYTFGQNLLPLNIGATKRHGYELEAGYNKTIRGFHFWVKSNFNFNENRVTEMDDPLLTPEYQKYAGKPIKTTRSFVNIGYYNNADEIANYSLRQSTLITPGADKLLDFDGDATWNYDFLTSKDVVPVGNTSRPNKTFGLSGGFEYKKFDLNFLMQGVTSVDRSWGSQSNPLWINDPGELYVKVEGRDDIWTPVNTGAAYANWGAWNAGSKDITDAQYIRLKSAEVGYTISGRFLKVVGLSSARLALQGSNLFTWTRGYLLGDPEEEASGENGNDGRFNAYPIQKRYTLALKINF